MQQALHYLILNIKRNATERTAQTKPPHTETDGVGLDGWNFLQGRAHKDIKSLQPRPFLPICITTEIQIKNAALPMWSKKCKCTSFPCHNACQHNLYICYFPYFCYLDFSPCPSNTLQVPGFRGWGIIVQAMRQSTIKSNCNFSSQIIQHKRDILFLSLHMGKMSNMKKKIQLQAAIIRDQVGVKSAGLFQSKVLHYTNGDIQPEQLDLLLLTVNETTYNKVVWHQAKCIICTNQLQKHERPNLRNRIP